MAAPRARAVLLGLVLALSVGLSPAAASVTGLHGPHGLAGNGLAGDHVLELLRETARAERAQVQPGPPERPAFTLWPAPPPENGHLFARAPEAPRLELVVLVPAIASDVAESLPETRIRAFGLFEPISRPGSNRVSRENATGYAFSLWGNRVGPTQKGLWTDPVTGIAYARARWYDARNASWLSEDPLGVVDSTNLYAFVGWQPNMGTDPYGYLTWGETWEFTKSAAKVVGTGAAVVVVATAAGASSPFLIAGGALVAAGYAIHSGTERIDAGQTDDAYEALKLGAGDATGVNAAFEGIAGVELVTGREIQGEERANRLGTATGVVATFAVAPAAQRAGVAIRQGASNALGRAIFPEGLQNPYSPEALAEGFSAMSGEVSSTAGAGGAGATVGAAGGTIGAVPRGINLAAHEAAGGHLIARHVGQTEAQLAARLSAQPRIPAASTFMSQAEAEAGVSTVLGTRAGQLSDWVSKGASGRLVLEAPFVGGQVLLRGASAPVAGSGVRIILEGTGGGAWRIVTGHPTP